MAEAERLCDWVTIVEHGRLIEVGRTEELVSWHCPQRTVVLAPASQSPRSACAIPHVEMVTSRNSQFTIQRRGHDFVTAGIHCLSENHIHVTDFRTVLPHLEDVFSF